MTESNWDSYWGTEMTKEYWQRPSDSVVRLISDLSPAKQPLVLDLGCGIGRHSIAFAQAGFRVTALDSSEQALKELNDRSQQLDLDIKIVNGDYSVRQFESQSFDIILSYNVLYHGCYSDMERAVDIATGYLRNEGILFFTCPTRQDGKYGNGNKIAPHTFASENSVHPGDVHYFASRDDIDDLMGDLTVISVKRNEHYWDNNGSEQFSSYWEVIAKNE